MNSTLKSLVFWMVLVVVGVLVGIPTVRFGEVAAIVEQALREKVIAPDFRDAMVDGRLALARLCALDKDRQEYNSAAELYDVDPITTRCGWG